MPKGKEYRYVGPEQRPPRVRGHQGALSPPNALSVIQESWRSGRVHVGTHFKKRCLERDIDMLDIENIIRDGVVRGVPEHCAINKNWKYKVFGSFDERDLEVIVALEPTEDYTKTPLVILVTTYKVNPQS